MGPKAPPYPKIPAKPPATAYMPHLPIFYFNNYLIYFYLLIELLI